MSEESKGAVGGWAARGLVFAAILISCYWCSMFTFHPNWKLYGVMAIVGVLDGMAGFIRGWLKCAKENGIEIQ